MLVWASLHYDTFCAGCGAFCAVTQANRVKSDRLVRLKYSPGAGEDKDNASWSFPHTGVTITDAARSSGAGVGAGGGSGVGASLLGALRPVVLVGKGVCYDTGGESNLHQIFLYAFETQLRPSWLLFHKILCRQGTEAI